MAPRGALFAGWGLGFRGVSRAQGPGV